MQLKKNIKINCSGLELNRGRLDEKRKLGLLILNRWSNNTQLLINGGAISKRFMFFKLFLTKSTIMNLVFLLANLFYFPITFIAF